MMVVMMMMVMLLYGLHCGRLLKKDDGDGDFDVVTTTAMLTLSD